MNVYEIINNRIIELMEAGTVPWHRPWNSEGNMPKNFVSKKDYRGINIFMLSCMPYDSPYWLTYKQCQDKGGHVIKGEKSTPVVFWKWLGKNDTETTEGEVSIHGKIPLLRYYSVFNLLQTEGIPLPEPEEEHKDHQLIKEPEEIIRNMPLKPELSFGGNRAAYSPVHDYITLPNLHTFESPEEYYSTCFHELIHSSGHIKRLGRKSILDTSFFGSHEYSKEELVAEMGAAFLCGYTGIEQKTLENSAAYIQGWLKVLKNDKTLLVFAAAQAQKAADYILNIKVAEEASNEDLAA